MFNSVRQVAKAQIRGDNLDLPSSYVPQGCTFKQVQRELIASDEGLSKDITLENLLILHGCLQVPDLVREADEQQVKDVSLWIAKAILPDSSVIPHDDIPSDSKPPDLERAIRTTQRVGILGLQCLQLLNTTNEPAQITLDPQMLISVIAFSSPRDSWTNATSLSIATSIISSFTAQISSTEFIIKFLIQGVIRPVFSKSKPTAVTSTGRKAMSSSTPRNFDPVADLDPANKPWKYACPYSITVFERAICSSSNEIIIQNWNLFIPPLLTLLDSRTTTIRSRALSILSVFLPKMGTKLLKQTGLGGVFEDAVSPTLMYLPAVTPVEESLQLLPSAYEAMFVLGSVQYARPVSGTQTQRGKEETENMKFYDRMMREGILRGYVHAQEYSGIVEILLQQLASLVERMGIYGVKHLKDILPIISTTLTDPFLPTSLSPLPKQKGTPNLLLTALNSLKAVLLACWPRISQPEHRILILRALVTCWMNVSDSMRDPKAENTEGLKELKAALREVGRLFLAVVRMTQFSLQDGGIEYEVKKLVDAGEGEGLGDLFEIFDEEES